MVRLSFLLILIALALACKKPEDRTCLKSYGEMDTLIHFVDSVQKFNLYSGIKYRFFQSNKRSVKVIGGNHLIKHVNIDRSGYEVDITNGNKCNFLRDYNKKIEVEIYYPHFHKIYAEISDSLVFNGIVTGNLLSIELRESGGILWIKTDVNDLRILVSSGPGSFIAKGKAKYTTLKIQGRGFGDAGQLSADFASIYQNSISNMIVNLESTAADVRIDGIGQVRYLGDPESLNVYGKGAGECVKIN